MGTLFRRGVIERIIGEYEWAAVSFGVAFEAASKGANPLAEMNCRSYLGTVHRIALEHSEAFDQLSVALDGYRRLQSRRGQAHTLLQLGILYRQQVRYAEAEQAMTAALTYYTGLRDFHDAAGVLLELGVLHRLSTDSTAALRLLDRALIVYEALGSRQGQSNVLYEIQARDRSTQPPAIVQPVLEYPSTSDTVEWFETTMAEWHSRGNHGSRLWGLRHYAAIAADTPTARDYLRRSIELALVLDSPWEASEAHRDLFDLDRHRRRPPRKNTCAIRLNPAESGSLPLLRAPYICDGSIQINSGSRTMANSLTKRTAAILCGLIATTAAMVAAGEPAQAASGGGCQGPGYANVCIGMDTGNIAYAGHTNYTTGTCTIHLMLWDYSAQAGGVPVFTKDFRCGSGQIDYRPAVLSNPTTGHDYKAEMRVDWGNSKVDTYLSPDLIA
ncbi:tetratricopeptide repeat protein [Nocardia sp. NBC_00511]|uniref:tetratricopeptide repeat protein n=1 Tax=Nocardia sp. NBC_00511 TaxID=2903591 RepID=UPI0030E3A746